VATQAAAQDQPHHRSPGASPAQSNTDSTHLAVFFLLPRMVATDAQEDLIEDFEATQREI
jgi:hypothetical protein